MCWDSALLHLKELIPDANVTAYQPWAFSVWLMSMHSWLLSRQRRRRMTYFLCAASKHLHIPAPTPLPFHPLLEVISICFRIPLKVYENYLETELNFKMEIPLGFLCTMIILRIFWLGSGDLEFATLRSDSQCFRSPKASTCTVDRRYVGHFLGEVISLLRKISENGSAKV